MTFVSSKVWQMWYDNYSLCIIKFVLLRIKRFGIYWNLIIQQRTKIFVAFIFIPRSKELYSGHFSKLRRHLYDCILLSMGHTKCSGKNGGRNTATNTITSFVYRSVFVNSRVQNCISSHKLDIAYKLFVIATPPSKRRHVHWVTGEKPPDKSPPVKS